LFAWAVGASVGCPTVTVPLLLRHFEATTVSLLSAICSTRGRQSCSSAPRTLSSSGVDSMNFAFVQYVSPDTTVGLGVSQALRMKLAEKIRISGRLVFLFDGIAELRGIGLILCGFLELGYGLLQCAVRGYLLLVEMEAEDGGAN
jgi:hypothetical protein